METEIGSIYLKKLALAERFELLTWWKVQFVELYEFVFIGYNNLILLDNIEPFLCSLVLVCTY